MHSRILKNGRIAGERYVEECITSYGGTMDKVEGKGWGIKVLILPLNSERELLEVREMNVINFQRYIIVLTRKKTG